MNDFYSGFNSAINEGNVSDANASLMKELAAILVRDKSDFVDMLNESGINANVEMSDAELISLFVDSAPSNKKLILGAALLVNVHNKKMGFDGEDEMDDDSVKKSYFTMKSCFVESADEDHSNLIPLGLIAKGVGKAFNAAKEQKSAKEQMKAEAIRRREEQKKKAEEERKRKQTNIYIFGGIAIVGVLIIGVVLMRRK